MVDRKYWMVEKLLKNTTEKLFGGRKELRPTEFWSVV